MDATLILADYAEAVNGKLYVAGGGWTELVALTPTPVALGVILRVPWTAANTQHRLEIKLVNQDGHQVTLGDPPMAIGQQGMFEVGRPPGLPPGSELPMVFAIRWPVLPLPLGLYAFAVDIDGTEIARVRFRTVERIGG